MRRRPVAWIAGALAVGLGLAAGAGLVGSTPASPPVAAESSTTLATRDAPGDYRDEVLADAPVAYWRFGEATGAVAVDEVGAYPGTYEGNPQLGVEGALGDDTDTAVLLDGTDDRIVADSIAKIGSGAWPGFTLEAWVYPYDVSEEAHPMAFSLVDGDKAPALLRDEPTDRFKYRDGAVEVFSDTIPLVGYWYHVVVTVAEDGTGRLYVNGQEQAGFSTDRRPPGDGLFTMGAEYDQGDPPTITSRFHGRLDEIAVYDHALSAGRVGTHYAAASASPALSETKTTLNVKRRQSRVRAKGRVSPVHDGRIKVTLFKKRGGSFVVIKRKRPALDDAGRYSTSFRRPKHGRCKVKAQFGGDENHLASHKSVKFRC